MTQPPFLSLIRIDKQITLRITQDGEIRVEVPVSVGNAALLVAEAALFLRDEVQKAQVNK